MAKNKDMCDGCYNVGYNYGLGGSKECWSYKDSTVVKKKLVHIDDVPPWNHPIKSYLSCYRPQRMLLIDGNRKG